MLRSLLALVVAFSCLLVSVSSQCSTPQVSCPAPLSLAEVPTAWYELTFATDPASVVGPTSYGWSANDTTESCPYTHTGIASFDGEGFSYTGQSYVDLNTVSGPNSAGNSISLNDDLPVIGGYNSSGSITAGTGGWSFEVTVKALNNTVWAKFYCLGAGAGAYDILTGFFETTLEIDHTLDYSYYGANANRVVFPPSPGIPLNIWQHIVAVYQNIDYQYETAPTGRIFIYVNGQLQNYADGSQYTYESIVPPVSRPYSYLGRSCYDDAIFQGSIDTFRIYDRALTAEQVDSLYHQQMGGCEVTTAYSPIVNDASPNQVPFTLNTTVAAPMFSLSASSDPRIDAGTDGTALYGWREYDFVDTLCPSYPATSYHQGLIVFPGGSNTPTDAPMLPYVTQNFINLSTATGPNSIGRELPMLGGASSGLFEDSSWGWSFEFVVKPGMQEQWSKVMDLGSTRNQSNMAQCNNDIVFGYYNSMNTLSATVCDSYGNQAANVQFTSFTPGQWVHAVVVFQGLSFNSSLSHWQLYQNGQLVNSVSGTYYPQHALRQNANLGLSNWNDPQFAGLLDTFNVYDQALSQSQVSALFDEATGGNTFCYSDPVSYIPADATFFAVDFSTDPRTVINSTYRWLPYDPTDSAIDQANHQGVIVLNGTSPVYQYVDLGLASGPASVTSQPISSLGGLGTGGIVDSSLGWSFEVVFKSFAQTLWGKVFDFSNHAADSEILGGSWDIVFGWQQSYQYYSVDLYYNVSQQDQSEYATSYPFPLNTWTHYVWVIQYDSSNTVYSQPGYPLATYYSYVNGQLYNYYFFSRYIDHVIRQHGFLGRSSYSNDSAWLGAIDTFRVYSVALNQQQVSTLYAASVGAGAGSESSSSSSSSTGASMPMAPSSPSSSPTATLCDAVASAPNLLYNPGFELGSTGYTIIGAAGVAYNPSSSHCGNYFLSLYAVGADATVSQSVSVESNTNYLFSFWVKSDGGIPNELSAVIAFYVDGSLQASAIVYASTDLPLSTQYLQYTAELPSPFATAGQQVTLTLNISGFDNPGALLVDDLYLYPALSSSSSSSAAAPLPPSSSSSSTGGSSPATAGSSSSAPSVLGDPQFVGLRGQSFQVHGIDGEVYALISEHNMQLNARFRFLTGPRPCPVMPSTGERTQACWSHDGSYLSEVGALVQATGEAVRAVAGNATQGFASVTVNGKQLAVGEATSTSSVQRISTHELVLTAGSFRVEMQSVDGFVNLRSVELTVPFSQLRSHGLLGQTWSSKRHQSTLKVVEGEVDDYVLAEGEVLGVDFVYNRYGVQTE